MIVNSLYRVVKPARMWAMKEVKLFNGGTPRHPDYRFYVGAWSAADAVRLMMSCTRAHLDAAYLSKMWSKGAWGDTMEGIPHARGVWASSGWGTGSEKLPWHLVDCDAKVLVHASQLPDKKNYLTPHLSKSEKRSKRSGRQLRRLGWRRRPWGFIPLTWWQPSRSTSRF